MRPRHDPFLKRLYRAGVRDALTLFLPEIAARLDWSHWQWLDKEIPILSRRRPPRCVVADLVGLTRDVEGRHLKVLLHPELQMQPDPTMDWRIFEYNTGLLLQEGDPEARVLTVVFYHCPGTGGIQQRWYTLDYHGIILNGVTYWTVGLGDLEAEAYAAQENPMGWALASWMRQRPESRVELRLQLLQKILRFAGGEAYQELLLDAVRTYYRLSGRERKMEEQLVRSGRYGEVETMEQTWLGRLKAKAEREGRQEGRHEGRQEGRQEGELLALQRAVQQVIWTRFPDAPARVIERVAGLQDLAALERLHQQVILAQGLEEIEALLAAAE